MESDVPHNQAGATETDPGGQVLAFPREWFGPRDELVPIGPRARAAALDEGDGAFDDGDRASEDRDPGPTQPQVDAEDFWGGLADAGDLVQFPADAVSADAPLVNRRRPRLAALAAATLCLAVIVVRVWAVSPGGSTQAGASLAQAALSIMNLPAGGVVVDQQQIRRVSVRAPVTRTTRRPAKRRLSRPAQMGPRRIVVSRSRPSSPAGSQPVVYSTPAAPPPATPPSSVSDTASSASGSGGAGGGGAGSGSGGGSGGGGSNGGGSRRAGPSGPGATFGPGKMGG